MAIMGKKQNIKLEVGLCSGPFVLVFPKGTISAFKRLYYIQRLLKDTIYINSTVYQR